jgi:uncharacterized membrane protein
MYSLLFMKYGHEKKNKGLRFKIFSIFYNFSYHILIHFPSTKHFTVQLLIYFFISLFFFTMLPSYSKVLNYHHLLKIKQIKICAKCLFVYTHYSLTLRGYIRKFDGGTYSLFRRELREFVLLFTLLFVVLLFGYHFYRFTLF